MNHIKVCMAPGEGDREQDLRIALSHDPRFDPLQIDSGIPVDLKFCVDIPCVEDYCGSGMVQNALHVELKEPNDFVASVLSGHLLDQVLSIRESGYNGCAVILGGLDDLYQAIDASNEKRLINGKFKFLNQEDRSNANAATLLRLKSFKKRSFLNGVPVFYKGDDSGFFDGPDQWKDILELASDYLTDGDMLGFRQRPANGEREILAASILFHGDGIGPGVLKPVMNEYRLALVPKGEYARQPLDMAGIGPKRAKLIEERIVMHYGH